MTDPLDINTGDRILVRFERGNPANATLHVRASVDGRLVVRKWLRGKKRWEYEVLSPEWLIVMRSHLTVKH